MLYIICNFNEVFRDVYESLVRKHLTTLKIDSWPVAVVRNVIDFAIRRITDVYCRSR